jgi:GNAT superfamily N-acetyltransferase
VVSETDRLDVATAARWQLASVVSTLATAFVEDPLVMWMFPDRSRRAGQVQSWWEHMVSRRPQGSRTWQAAQVASAALWYPPTGTLAGVDDGFGSWFEDLLDDPALTGERFDVFSRIIEGRPAEPHWYLAGVGTRPEHQGRGLGAAILAPMLQQCDDEGRPAHLESSNPRNVSFYHRLGFETVDTFVLPDGSSTVAFMQRGPR